MATPVEVPKLGNTVEECIVARWLKAPGRFSRRGDMVAEIETDKATFEVSRAGRRARSSRPSTTKARSPRCSLGCA